MKFRQITSPALLDDIFTVYAAAIDAMENERILQWDDDDQIAVCFALCEECDPQY